MVFFGMRSTAATSNGVRTTAPSVAVTTTNLLLALNNDSNEARDMCSQRRPWIQGTLGANSSIVNDHEKLGTTRLFRNPEKARADGERGHVALRE